MKHTLSSTEVKHIFAKNTPIHSRSFVILTYQFTEPRHYKYCVAISTKIGNAVTRNHYKRLFKSVLYGVHNINKDIVVIAKPSITHYNPDQILKDFNKSIDLIRDPKPQFDKTKPKFDKKPKLTEFVDIKTKERDNKPNS